VQAKPCLFRLRRDQVLSTKRADLEGRRARHQQGRALPLHRHFRANDLAGAGTRLPGPEEACSSTKPLVELLQSALAVVLDANVPQSQTKCQ